MSKGIAIIGAGSLGRIVYDIYFFAGKEDEVEGFYDDKKEGEHCGVGINGCIDDVEDLQPRVIAIGDIETRKSIYESMADSHTMFNTAVHRSAVLSVSETNVIGRGSIVKAGAVLEPGHSIGVNCIIGNNSTICHDVEIGNHCRISPGVTIAGNVKIGDEVYLCPGVTVQKGVEIADRATVLAPAVYKDLDREGKTYEVNKI